jgi:NitT/TauT family transport system permease protein
LAGYRTGAASVALFAAGVLLLEVAVNSGLIPAAIVAPPSQILTSFAELYRDGQIAGPFFNTLESVFAAALVAALAGIVFGHFLARRDAFAKAYLSWLGGAFSAPIVLLYPLFLVLFGRTQLTVIVMASITAFIPVAIKSYEAFSAVPLVLLDVGMSFKVDPRRLFFMIELPAALPRLFIGLRLSIIYALVNVIAIEYLIDFGGLGRVVSDLYAAFNIPAMYAGIVLILVLSGGLLGMLDVAQRYMRSR